MSRRPALVTQADVARALRAVEQTGYHGEVVIGTDGTIRIVPAHVSAPSSTVRALPLDEPRKRIKL